MYKYLIPELKKQFAEDRSASEAQHQKVQAQMLAAQQVTEGMKAGGTGGAGTGRAPRMKKDVFQVANIKEKQDVHEFRQWLRTLELHMEAHYDWKFADLVFQKLRHTRKPITDSSFADMLVEINAEVATEANGMITHKIQTGRLGLR